MARRSLSEWLRPARVLSPVHVDFMLGDESSSLSQMLTRLTPIVSDVGRCVWDLDLRDCTYIGPYAAAVIYAACLQADLRGQKYIVRLPESGKVRSFIEFSGLSHLLHNGRAPDPNHPDNETVALSVVKMATTFVSNPIVELIRRHAPGMSQEVEDQLRRCMDEVIQNVADHSRSPIGAVTCARYIRSKGVVRVGIVDRGEGIYRTLRRKHPDTDSPRMALQRVIDGGWSAKTFTRNMGLGVSNLWMSVTRSLKGNACIITDDSLAMSKPNGLPLKQQHGFNFAGTGVFFTVPVVDERVGI
jgi:hypothetical protein